MNKARMLVLAAQKINISPAYDKVYIDHQGDGVIHLNDGNGWLHIGTTTPSAIGAIEFALETVRKKGVYVRP